ncbi:MAG: ABC transporter permease [Defluviitaleaceae bacterium]|nr:ABC transporter permease [Defluviitaleaceae bacterium]
MNKIWAVIRFEFLTFTKSSSFIGMTLLMVAISVIGPTIPTIIHLFQNAGLTEERIIAVVDNTGRFDEYALEYNLTPRVIIYDDISSARLAVGEGRFSYAVELNHYQYTLYTTAMGARVVNLMNQLDNLVRTQYQLEQFDAMGIDSYQVHFIMDFEPYGKIMTVGSNGEVGAGSIDDFWGNAVFAYVLSFMLYFSLLTGSQYILTSVVREKSTKTMEILITSCKSDHLINGKVLGVGAASLLQLLLVVALGSISLYINGILMLARNPVDIETLFVTSTVPMDIIILMLVYFVLGFAMYAYMQGALASTISRMEDASSVSGLPVMLVVIGFLAAMVGFSNPNAGWYVALSYVPFFAPFVMFVRICVRDAAAWEIGLSIATQIITIGILAWLGSRIYRMGTLAYGNRPKLKDFIDAIK